MQDRAGGLVGFGVERTPSARARVVSRVERDRILRGENDGVRLDGLNGGLGVRCQDAIQGDLRVVEKALGAQGSSRRPAGDGRRCFKRPS